MWLDLNGVLIIDKPQDFTSFDIVAIARNLTGQRKIGHTGTLDPMATGVLPLLLGRAAKAQSILPDSNKEYIAQLKFGITTDTLDITGTKLTEQATNIKEDEFINIVELFKGTQLQTPPMYSAVKVNGKKLYELARQGIEIERKPREITVFELEVLDFDENKQEASIRVSCSSGTYIRSLIDDVGKKLGCGAVMTSLKRTCACGYSIKDAISIEELRKMTSDEIKALIKDTETIFSCYKELTISQAQATRFSNGGALDIKRTSMRNNAVDNDIIRILSPDKKFIGLGITDTQLGLIKIHKLF